VLALVVADRHEVGLVEQDVRRLKDGVGEEARRDEVLLVAFLLELGHPAQLAVARDRPEQPGALGVCAHMALCEQRRALRLESGREEEGRERERRLAEVVGVVGGRDRVQVDDAEEGVAFVLRADVIPDRADVVAEVLCARRLDARKDPHSSQVSQLDSAASWP